MLPLILNIESATDICSVCLSKGNELLHIKDSEQGYNHAAVITRLIESLFAETGMELSQLDAVSLSKGPGSYTSLRVGASTAKGICYALGIPFIVIDTLESIARATLEKEQIKGLYAPMIDARRMEVYTMLYGADMKELQPLNALIIDEASFADYFDKGKTIVFSGNGAPKCNNVINSPLAVFSDVICSSAHLIPLSVEAFEAEFFSDIAYFSPTYFKAPNITISKKTL
jgi:tRNA threonylcarbamoyladenosine biosynthesis protein TsaB